MFKTTKVKWQVTYKDKTIIITPDFMMKNQKDRCTTDYKKPQMPSHTTIPVKLSIFVGGQNKIFHD